MKIRKEVHGWSIEDFLYVPEVECSFTKALAPTKDV